MPSVTAPHHCQKLSWIFEQTGALLCKTFNSASYHWRKCVLDRLIDGKAKVKETLRDQSESMKSFVNKFLFGFCLENEFSKSLKTEQNLKSLFT